MTKKNAKKSKKNTKFGKKVRKKHEIDYTLAYFLDKNG